MKQEVLNGISNLDVHPSMFEHDLIPDSNSTDSHLFEIETENYLIELELIEYLECDNYGNVGDNYLTVGAFHIFDENGGPYEEYITDEEILRHINY